MMNGWPTPVSTSVLEPGSTRALTSLMKTVFSNICRHPCTAWTGSPLVRPWVALAKIGLTPYSQSLHRQLMLDNVHLSPISLGPASAPRLLCLPPLCLASFIPIIGSPSGWSFALTGNSSLALLPSTPWHPLFRGIPYFQSLLQLPQSWNGLLLESHSPLSRLSSATYYLGDVG